MESAIGLIAIIMAILQIIMIVKFFELVGNVRDIKEILLKQAEKEDKAEKEATQLGVQSNKQVEENSQIKWGGLILTILALIFLAIVIYGEFIEK